MSDDADTYDFSGTWRSSYTFTTASPDADFTNEYDVKIHRAGNQLVIQSVPNDEGSYILLRLTLDDRLLTGTWYEHTAEKGHYKGVMYYGPLQLVMDKDGNAMRGNWLGVDDQMKMQGGEQTIVRVNK
jgi:hypothetical protein